MKRATCATCARFTVEKGTPEAAEGIGTCTGFERPTDAQSPFCVLYLRAANWRDRERWATRISVVREAATGDSGKQQGDANVQE